MAHCNVIEQRDVPDCFVVDFGKVYSTLKHIKTTKSPGPDKIPNKILKTFALELAPIVTHIYNASMLQRTFPQQLKRSLVVPIPKLSPPGFIKDDLGQITLTSQIGKVMEGFTLDSLLNEVSSKLDSKQFTLAGRSTTQVLVYLLHLIHAGLDVGHCYARLFFAEFKKGLDLVDQNNIIGEFENLRVYRAIIRWIKAFLIQTEHNV